MSKVILNLAISLDGYIARLDDSVDYLGEEWDEETNKDFIEFTNNVDVIIMGSTSYDNMLKMGDYPWGDKFTYVLTSQEYADEENFMFTDMEIEELLLDAKARANKNIYLFGGAKVVKQFIDLDYIDEFIITIAPIIIGTGIPLFLFSNEDKPLKLKSTKEIQGFVTLHYERVRNESN